MGRVGSKLKYQWFIKMNQHQIQIISLGFNGKRLIEKAFVVIGFDFLNIYNGHCRIITKIALKILCKNISKNTIEVDPHGLSSILNQWLLEINLARD